LKVGNATRSSSWEWAPRLEAGLPFSRRANLSLSRRVLIASRVSYLRRKGSNAQASGIHLGVDPNSELTVTSSPNVPSSSSER
jgi:hypothetical protein